MKSKQTQLILIQILCIFGFTYTMWTDTNLFNQNSVSYSLLFIIAVFHLLMFFLMIFTLHANELSKNKSSLILDLNVLVIAFIAFLGAGHNCLLKTNNLGVNYLLMITALFASVFLFFEIRNSMNLNSSKAKEF